MTQAVRELGRSGLKTRPFAFGGNVFGWSADQATSFALLDAFVDAGFSLIDTADAYSAWVPGNTGGESETIIGQWLKKTGRRDEVLIATKVAKWNKYPGLSANTIKQAVESSLQRLQTDVIDLYQAHEDDPNTPLEETLSAFAELIREGKVRAIGASNYSGPRLQQAIDVANKEGLPRFETMQPEYNLYDRFDYERNLRPVVQQNQLGVISYYSLASGFLSGKYRNTSDADKSNARGSSVVDTYINPRGLRILDALQDIASRHQATSSQIALAWLMAQPTITAPIASARNVEQLTDILQSVSIELSSEDLAQLQSASEEV